MTATLSLLHSSGLPGWQISLFKMYQTEWMMIIEDFRKQCHPTGGRRYVHKDVADEKIWGRESGWSFDKPNPLSKNQYMKMLFIGWKSQGSCQKSQLDEIAEKSLIQAALWNDQSRMNRKSALSLSGGQQQRLCISAGCGSTILLMDELKVCLDPISSTAKLKNSYTNSKKSYDHHCWQYNMQQAARVSDKTAFFI